MSNFNPLQKNYFFIYAEWVQLPQTSIVAPGEQPAQAMLMGANAVIDVHPVTYLAAMSRDNPSYKIKWAMQITREMYEMVVGPARENNNGHNGDGGVELQQ